MSARRFPAIAACVLTMMLLVTGCGPNEPNIVHNPLLLTVEEAGGGKLAPLQRNNWEAGVPLERSDWGDATLCGPDNLSLFYPVGQVEHEYDENLVRYNQDNRSVVIGIATDWKIAGGDPFFDMRYRLNHGCAAHFDASDPSVKWIVTQIAGYPDNAFAFQSVEWGVKKDRITEPEAPADPASEGNDWVKSSARVYTVIDNQLVFVRIDQQTPEPPSSDDLRKLWEAQIAKIEAADSTPK